MLSLWGTLSLTFLVACRQVHANEIPIIDGVLGGVPQRSSLAGHRVTLFEENPLATPGKVRLTENSGLCEKTPNVYEASGYVDISTTDSIWFWFFAARNKPENTPLVLWFNGGPGSSSLYGLFQAHGPCRINNSTQGVHHNPYSWNTNANILYIDQPAGAGFSLSGSQLVGSSEEAAVDVWKFIQIWLSDERFKQFIRRDIGVWAESYGGHYGPTFVSYFLAQNAAIAAKEIDGIPLKITTLGIGNGITDPLTQYEQFANYSANNPYNPTVDEQTLNLAKEDWTREGGCRDQIVACNAGGNNTVCSNAQHFCNEKVAAALLGIYDQYHVATPRPNPYPPEFGTWLNENRGVLNAQKNWTGPNLDIYWNFAANGDWMRSSRGYLEEVVEKGIKVGIYAGDADYIVHYFGVEAMMEKMETRYSKAYREQSYKNYTVNGEVTGVYKRAGLISYLRVYGAGHMVPAYTYGNLAIGEAALQMFNQIQLGKGLVPT